MKKLKIFIWEGLDLTGMNRKGIYSALTRHEVLLRLQSVNITVTKIERRILLNLFNRVSQRDISALVRQFATLLSAKIPLTNIIEIILRENKNILLSGILQSVQDDLAQGNTLSSSLSHYSEYFNHLTINLIKHSEEIGTLEQTFLNLADYFEKKLTLHKTLKGMLYYPLFVLGTCIMTMSFLLAYIVPQFATLFQTFNTQLPLYTRLVMHASQSVQNFSGYLILGLLFAFILFSKLNRLLGLTLLLRDLALHLPFIRRIFKQLVITRITRALATSLSVGIPLLEALTSVIAITNHKLYAKAILQARSDLLTGQPFYITLKNTKLFSNTMLGMIAIGEESGKLVPMLNKIANIHEQELEYLFNHLSKLLEPALMIFLGAIIGFFVYAIYLPIFKLGGL